MIGKWLFKRFMQFHVFIYRRSGGKTMGVVRGMPVLLLTTMGNKSGKPRVIPVMYMRDKDTYVVTASNNGDGKHPGWYINLQANPQAIIEVDNQTLTVTAHTADKETKNRLWPMLVAKAPFFSDYQQKTSRDIPMVILQPTSR